MDNHEIFVLASAIETFAIVIILFQTKAFSVQDGELEPVF